MAAVLIGSLAFNVYQFTQTSESNRQKDAVSARLQMSSILTQLQFQANAEFGKLNSSLLSACAQLSTAGLNSSQARTILSSLAEEQFVINAATCNPNDIIEAVEPAQYSSIEGADISDQEQNVRMHQTLQSTMSDAIPLVEGFDGVVMVAPIFDANQTFAGSLSIVFQPNELLNATIAPAVEDTPFSLFAMQIDGRVLYDADPAQEGKMTFTDPSYANYPELLALAHVVAAEPSGYGTYNFPQTLASAEPVHKEAYWTTIGIYGTEWRLLILHTMNTA